MIKHRCTRGLKSICLTPAFVLFKFLSVSLCILSLSACATGAVDHEPSIQISGTVIENQTEMFVSAVRLLVPVTGNFVSCGNIPPGSMCSTTFPEAAYTGNPVEITWSAGGQIHSTGQFALQLPIDIDAYKTAVVQVVISGPESAGAIIVQHSD